MWISWPGTCPSMPRRAVAVGAMHGRADRDKEIRIVRRNVLAVESVRILLGDERRREAPFAKRGCRTSADWNTMLDAMPRITNAFSASVIRVDRLVAARRVQTSLAIIES